MQWWASARSRAVLVLHPSPTPVPNVPQFTRNKQEIKRLKKQKEKKKKSPHPPSGPASTPLTSILSAWVSVHACMCVRISVCAVMAARVSENMWGLVCVCVCACEGSMGVRGTPSISSPGRTPSLRDSRCSSSAGERKKKKKVRTNSFKSLILLLSWLISKWV